ncbi:MAG: GNAT family N-acetyltransferase [Clostridiales bacterium]|jgi:aminoglycoside 6'-N-acetyltransferase I|nr:GNAT family N-acetyltransferase [Clostridiales bacterium]
MLNPFAATDLAPATAMFHEIFKNPPWSYDWITKEKIADYFADLLHSPKSVCYTYTAGGVLSGVCFGAVGDCSPVPVYEIKEIFVRPDAQNQGLGSAMLKAIEADLKQKDIPAIRLYTLRTIPAFDFYLKNGFQEIAEAAALSRTL